MKKFLPGIVLLLSACGGEPAPVCEGDTEGIGQWQNTEIPADWGTFDGASDGKQLLMMRFGCSACSRATLDFDPLNWTIPDEQSNIGISLRVSHVATPQFVFGQGGMSAASNRYYRLDGHAVLLDRAVGLWSPFVPPSSYHLRGGSFLFWTGKEFGVWGGYGPVDADKDVQRLALDPDARYLTHYDGLLFDPVTHNWREIPPVRGVFEQGKDETRPSVAATVTASGLFVWGTNPERTGNWGAIFDFGEMRWIELDARASVPPLRMNHQLLTVGDEVFLFGGQSGSGDPSRRLFRYSLESNRWGEVEVPSWADPINGTVVDGKLVFLGRCSSGARFDPARGTWELLKGEGGPPSRGTLHGVGRFLAVTGVYTGESEAEKVWVLDLGD